MDMTETDKRRDHRLPQVTSTGQTLRQHRRQNCAAIAPQFLAESERDRLRRCGNRAPHSAVFRPISKFWIARIRPTVATKQPNRQLEDRFSCSESRYLIFRVQRADGQLFVFAVPGGYERTRSSFGIAARRRSSSAALLGRSSTCLRRVFMTTWSRPAGISRSGLLWFKVGGICR